MALQFDQLNNQLKTNDSTNANASMVLTPSGTGSVLLNGTGQNLLLNSNPTTNATYWVANFTTLTASQADPFGGSTATLVTADGSNNNHNQLSTQIAFINGLTYTQSAYFKAGTNNFVQMRTQGAIGGVYANFNISTGVVGTFTTTSASMVSVGNGWYRCSITYTATTTANSGFQFYIVTSNTAVSAETNTLLTSIYVYGAQVEIGSTANTYTPTTTTAIYNAPVLSFSGVSNIGLQSDGSLYVQPAGTGALQAQATTSSTVGGNARGANAIDWQMYRTSASNVASGSTSFIGSGRDNKATGQDAVVTGGYNNQATTAQAAALSGSSNNCGGGESVIAGGQSGTVGLNFSGILTGYNNNASGYFGTVLGGFANSTTSNTQVTSQAAATTSSSTAVTLSASNASIKVGQLITGTGINFFPPTYVAAISGTSLTLSQNATATNASVTLAFFTAHGVVVGGGNNQATGSYSFIGGGGDAGTAANRNTASGDWSFVGGGTQNIASGIQSVVVGSQNNQATAQRAVVVGGFGNQATNSSAFIGGGETNLASGVRSMILGGSSNQSTGDYSSVIGGSWATTRGITSAIAFGAGFPPISATLGVSQGRFFILGRQTTDATATVLAADGNAAGSTNQVILPNNSAYYFKGEIISGVTGGGDSKGWEISGVIKRGAGVGTTTLVGVTVTSMYADVGAATWSIAVTADTTNGGLAVTFTGQASTTIRTVAQIRTTEMTY